MHVEKTPLYQEHLTKVPSSCTSISTSELRHHRIIGASLSEHGHIDWNNTPCEGKWCVCIYHSSMLVPKNRIVYSSVYSAHLKNSEPPAPHWLLTCSNDLTRLQQQAMETPEQRLSAGNEQETTTRSRATQAVEKIIWTTKGVHTRGLTGAHLQIKVVHISPIITIHA